MRSLQLRREIAAQPFAIFALVGVSVANLAVYSLWTRPRWIDFSRSTAAVRQGERAEETLLPILDQARRTYGVVLRAESDLAELASRVEAASGSIANVVAALRNTVRATGLKVDRINYAVQAVDELDVLQLQVELPVEGSYAAVRQLLHDLEIGPLFVAIEQVALAVPELEESGRRLRIRIALSVFVRATRDVASGARVATGGQKLVPETPMTAAAIRSAGYGGAGPGSSNGVLTAGSNIQQDPLTTAEQLRLQLTALPSLGPPAASFAIGLQRLDDLDAAPAVPVRNLFAFDSETSWSGSTEVTADELAEPAPVPEPTISLELVGIIRAAGTYYASLTDGDQVFVVTGGDLLPSGVRVIEVAANHTRLEAGDLRTLLQLRNNK